ncbi:MAG: M28 family peptidase [Clostridia bacterium]|nr:M28 family peptidase [Clostridia bacterium]MBO5024458.1 M28 family peptidase [Clostridia bacterium]
MEISGKRMYSLLKKLNFVRLSTTEGEKRAAAIIADEVREAGIDPKIETFMAPRYEIKKVKFEVTEPEVREYEVSGYGFSGNAAKDGIEADFYYLESFDEMCLAEAKGKIVFVAGGVGVENYKKLVKAGALAFVSTCGTWTDKKSETDLDERMLRPIHTDEGVIPGVCMRIADGLRLVASKPKKVKLTLEQEEGEAESQNIVAEIPGTKFPEEVIVYTAHYDSVVFSPGMFDNASGSATILELLRYFAKNPPLRTLKFIFCGSEERGLLGSKAYVEAHKDELKNYRLCVNVDMTGPLLGFDCVRVMGGASLCYALEFMKKEIGYATEIRQDIYSSDAIPFADNGIPGVNFIRTAADGTTRVHTRYDVITQVDPAKMARTAAFALEFSKRTVNAVYFPIERKLPEEIAEKVEVYLRKKKPEKKDKSFK